MAHVLLFHSALGLRPAVLDAAERLRSLEHEVTAPDYYAGQVFDNEGDGVAHRDRVGVRALMATAGESLTGVRDDAVLAGFSLGAFFAQAFAAGRPAARAAILLHGVAAPRGPWNGVPVQVHRYASDPWIEQPDVQALGEAVRASGAPFDDVVVDGHGHLFTDLGTDDGDEAAYAASITRLDAFLRA